MYTSIAYFLVFLAFTSNGAYTTVVFGRSNDLLKLFFFLFEKMYKQTSFRQAVTAPLRPMARSFVNLAMKVGPVMNVM